MTYEEFLDMPTTFMDDMLKVVNIKNKYRLKFTEEEFQSYSLLFDSKKDNFKLKKFIF